MQRVGFRTFVLDAARAFDIVGEVRNMEDGGVGIVAVGTEENLASFIEQIEIGPASSRVDDILSSDVDPPPRFVDFTIVR